MHPINTLPNWVGYFGFLLVLITYSLNISNKIKATGLSYSLINLIGSVCLLYSLYHTPNWPSILIECAWLAVSLYGVVRALYLPIKTQGQT